MTIRITDELKRLLDEYTQIRDSDRNRQTRKLWRKTRAVILDKFRGIPNDLSQTGGKIPFCCWPGFDVWRRLWGLDIGRYHTDPEYFLANWLRMKIYWFQNFDDDSYYDNAIPIWLGEGFETAFFGMTSRYSARSEPWLDRSTAPLLHDDEFEKLAIDEFEGKGLLPLAQRFYEEISAAVSNYGMEVDFIVWGTGLVYGANCLRGVEQMSMDYLLDPQFASRLLGFLAKTRNAFNEYRTRYLGGDTGEHQYQEIWNDDAAVPLVSPQIFRDIVWPHEKTLYDSCGGFSYYHNCGPMGPLLHDIARFANIEMIHMGPFSDPRQVLDKFAHRSAIEHCIKPQDDMMRIEHDDMVKRLHNLRTLYEHARANAVTIRATGYLSPALSIEQNIGKLTQWTLAARAVFG